jgi:hypothetical protein
MKKKDLNNSLQNDNKNQKNSNGGVATDSIMATPMMQQKSLEHSEIFGSEPLQRTSISAKEFESLIGTSRNSDLKGNAVNAVKDENSALDSALEKGSDSGKYEEFVSKAQDAGQKVGLAAGSDGRSDDRMKILNAMNDDIHDDMDILFDINLTSQSNIADPKIEEEIDKKELFKSRKDESSKEFKKVYSENKRGFFDNIKRQFEHTKEIKELIKSFLFAILQISTGVIAFSAAVVGGAVFLIINALGKIFGGALEIVNALIKFGKDKRKKKTGEDPKEDSYGEKLLKIFMKIFNSIGSFNIANAPQLIISIIMSTLDALTILEQYPKSWPGSDNISKFVSYLNIVITGLKSIRSGAGVGGGIGKMVDDGAASVGEVNKTVGAANGTAKFLDKYDTALEKKFGGAKKREEPKEGILKVPELIDTKDEVSL